jgi:hypothetical protein
MLKVYNWFPKDIKGTPFILGTPFLDRLLKSKKLGISAK